MLFWAVFHLTTSFCQAKKLNVLFIGSDDLRPNLGIYSGTCLSSQILAQIHFLLSSCSFSIDCWIPCPFSGANEGVFASPAMVTPNLDKVSKWSVRKFSHFFFEKRRLSLPSWVNVALYSSRPMCSKRWGGNIDSIDQFVLIMIAQNNFTWQWQNDKLSNEFVFHKVCSPSRSSMLTSRRPDTTRVQDLYAW